MKQQEEMINMYSKMNDTQELSLEESVDFLLKKVLPIIKQ